MNKSDTMFNGYGQLQALEKMDKNSIYSYKCRDEPTHLAFIFKENVDGTWLVKTRGEATEWLVDMFNLKLIDIDANK